MGPMGKNRKPWGSTSHTFHQLIGPGAKWVNLTHDSQLPSYPLLPPSWQAFFRAKMGETPMERNGTWYGQSEPEEFLFLDGTVDGRNLANHRLDGAETL